MAKIIEKQEWITRKALFKVEADRDGNVTSLGTQKYCSNCNSIIEDIGKFCPHCGEKFNGMTRKEENELKNNPKEKSLEVEVIDYQLHEDKETAEDFIQNYVIEDLIFSLEKENFMVTEDDFDYNCECESDEADNDGMFEFKIEIFTTVGYMDNGTDIDEIKKRIRKIFSDNSLNIEKIY